LSILNNNDFTSSTPHNIAKDNSIDTTHDHISLQHFGCLMHDHVVHNDHLSDKGEEYCPEISDNAKESEILDHCQAITSNNETKGEKKHCPKVLVNDNCIPIPTNLPTTCLFQDDLPITCSTEDLHEVTQELPIVPEELCADWDIGEQDSDEEHVKCKDIHEDHADNTFEDETIVFIDEDEDLDTLTDKEDNIINNIFENINIWNIPTKDDSHDPTYEAFIKPGYILKKTNDAIQQAFIDISTTRNKEVHKIEDYHQEKKQDNQDINKYIIVYHVNKEYHKYQYSSEDDIHYMEQGSNYYSEIYDIRERKLFIINNKMNKRCFPQDVREYLTLNGKHNIKDKGSQRLHLISLFKRSNKPYKILISIHKINVDLFSLSYHHEHNQHTNRDKVNSARYVAQHTVIFHVKRYKIINLLSRETYCLLITSFRVPHLPS
jgi:hypothetical protein